MTKKLGVNRDDIKKKNRGLVLKLVATGQCSSRIELSEKTGLTKTAISQITGELIKNGLLTETHKQKVSEPGRRPMGLDIAAGAPLAAGILIERGYAEAVLCDMKLNIRKHQRVEAEWKSGDELMETVYHLAEEMIDGEPHVAGIGVAAIGPVNANEGVIVNPLFFHGVSNVEVKRLLKERFGLPVCMDHDNQSAALAERLYGNGGDVRDLLLIGIGAGVGSGIISRDERYQCGSGFAPEIGHVSINYNGNRCVCGNRGCLETYISSAVVLKRLREATGLDYDYQTFCAHTEDPVIDGIFLDVVEKLGIAIVSILSVLNSDLIILGLDSVFWPDKYIRFLEEKINEGKFNNRNVKTQVRKAYFLEKTHVLGAACNVLDRMFRGELIE